MKKDFVALFFLSAITLLVYRFTLLNFFAQDDFILINYFSQNNLIVDFRNALISSEVTHWRPIHNIYFLISGNLFGKNFMPYHFLTFLFHIGASLLIYKIILKLFKRSFVALMSGLLYAVHPAHFVSLFWISGGATTIGFFFLAGSFYSYLVNRRFLSLVLFALGLLATEAMLVGLGLFFIWLFLKKHFDKKFIGWLLTISAVFFAVKFFTLERALATYSVEFSSKSILAVKYYLLRIAGFGEISGDLLSTFILVIFLAFLGVLVISKFNNQNLNLLLFSFGIIILGLFPFILIPDHLSPHYMNVSIFGLAILFPWILSQFHIKIKAVIFLLFVIASIITVDSTRNNNWVIRRSNLAKTYIEKIDNDKAPIGSTIFFNDSPISSSREAYFALGTGKAFDFWFPAKKYKYCFSEFENCGPLP